MLACASCTHNNGDIGPLFGNWKVESIKKDGVEIADYNGNLFMAFQNQVFAIIQVNNEMHSVSENYAKWERQEDVLIINFADTNYAPPSGSYMKSGENICTISYLNGSKMEFSLENDGYIYTYKLIKW